MEKSAKYPNFYENLKEAQDRLRGCIVLYSGEPNYIWAICDHKPDGKFRVYMSPIEVVHTTSLPPINQIPSNHPSLGSAIDTFLDANASLPVVRKMMDSPAFNKFRPFPLGMCNQGSQAFYV